MSVGTPCAKPSVRSLRLGGFRPPDVQAFIRQYLDMVERWFRPGGEGFKALLDDHRSILKEMRRVLEQDGDDGVRGMVSEDRTEYRDALTKLVRESRHDPKQLRALVADYLKGGRLRRRIPTTPRGPFTGLDGRTRPWLTPRRGWAVIVAPFPGTWHSHITMSRWISFSTAKATRSGPSWIG